MLEMKQLREEIKGCLKEIEFFTTGQLKEMLQQKGYVYNKDYDVNAFSNALHSLVNQKVIVSADKEKKGNYKVLPVSYDDRKNNENKKEKNKTLNNELELKDMREKIKNDINGFCVKIEQILDSEKPSTYGRNRQTYEDILNLVDTLKTFKFNVEK